MDLEGTIEKVQESSCVLVQARNLPEGTIEKVQERSSVLVQARDLPGGPRRYYKKYRKVHLYWCRPGTFQVDLEGTIEKVQESSPVLMQDM